MNKILLVELILVKKGKIVTLKTDKNRRDSQVKAWDAAASNEVFFQPTSWEEDPFLQQIQREVHLTPEMKVLDIGCGGGRYALALAERVGYVVGIDVSPKMIENAREWAKKKGVRCSIIIVEVMYYLYVWL